MAIHDVDFLLELQRHAVTDGQTFLANRLCTLLESRIRDECEAGRLTAEELFGVKIRFRENLALVNDRMAQVARLLGRMKGDHESLGSVWTR